MQGCRTANCQEPMEAIIGVPFVLLFDKSFTLACVKDIGAVFSQQKEDQKPHSISRSLEPAVMN